VSDYSRRMEGLRKETSFSTLPPELQPSPDIVDPLEGAGFGPLTEAQEERLGEEAEAKSSLYGERDVDKAIELADWISLGDPTPLADLVSTSLQLGRGVMDDASQEELSGIGAIGLAAIMTPFISARQLKLFKKHDKTVAAEDARIMLGDYSEAGQRRVSSDFR
jgi:hypothetical protein